MIWALVLAGGRGTRFWPESRLRRPKQFIRLIGSRTLLEDTLSRIRPLIPPARTMIATSRDKTRMVRRFTLARGAHVIGEPVGRNTASCAAVTAAHILKQDPDAVLVILPADHHIRKTAAFRKGLRMACQKAVESRLPVTFGILPAYPFTGYGYLETGKTESRSGAVQFRWVKRFCEKPDAARARFFYQSGRFLWNSGIFVWRADELLKAVRRFLPEAYELSVKIAGADFASRMKREFPKMPDISIDYGLMEKLKGKILTVPMDLGWNDVGGWRSLEDFFPCDSHNNILRGVSVVTQSRGNIVKGGKRLVALVGVNDLIVVDTDDALLVCSKKETEKIRDLVKILEKRKWNRYL